MNFEKDKHFHLNYLYKLSTNSSFLNKSCFTEQCQIVCTHNNLTFKLEKINYKNVQKALFMCLL